VSKTTLVLFVLAGAALVGFAVAAMVERTTRHESAATGDVAAKPQTVPLDWHEWQGTRGERLGFGVERFQVLEHGWRARISIVNDSKVAFGLDRAQRAFGLMLFASGRHRELDLRNREQTLPSTRPALVYKPALPQVLEPHTTWSGTISAPGALVAGSWMRVVFGTFDPIGKAPDAFPTHLTWITDRAYQLRA
jgi:hypothetical protein